MSVTYVLIYSVLYSVMLPLRKLAQVVMPFTFTHEMLSLDLGQNSDCSELTVLCSPPNQILAKNLNWGYAYFFSFPFLSLLFIHLLLHSTNYWAVLNELQIRTLVIKQSRCIYCWTKNKVLLTKCEPKLWTFKLLYRGL